MLPRLNQSGLSIVQVIVAAGIGFVILSSIIGAQVNSARENRALAEKLSALELQRQITAALSSPASCSLLFTKPGNVISGQAEFETTGPFPHTILLRAIPISLAEDVVSLDSPFAALSNSLRVRAADGIRLVIANATETPTLEIFFDSSSLIRSIRHLSFPVRVTTAVAGTTHTITGCDGAGAAGGPGGARGLRVFNYSGTWTVPANVTSIMISAVGGGGGGALQRSVLFTPSQATAGGDSFVQGCPVVGGGGGAALNPSPPGLPFGIAGAGGIGSGGTTNWSGGVGTAAGVNEGDPPNAPGLSAAMVNGLPFLSPFGAGGLVSGTVTNHFCSSSPAAGGGGGGAAVGPCTVTPGQVLTVVVGDAGLNARLQALAVHCTPPLYQAIQSFAGKGAVVIEW